MDVCKLGQLPHNAVLALIAPTASGKTDLAYRLYDTGRCELISVDSALVYQGMDIGTAKPTPDELARYPHHLVNIIRPTQVYSVTSFVKDVATLINDIHDRGKIPILVGGTMMYHMALLDGISDVPESGATIRKQVATWLAEQGIAKLYEHLQKHDPVICQKIKISDTQRITRALEVLLQTDVPMSTWQNHPKVALSHDPSRQWLALSVEPSREWLHERIALRLEHMWQAGFLAEVIALLQKYPTLSPELPALRTVGYRQVVEYLAVIDHPVMHLNNDLQALAQDLQKHNAQAINSLKNSDKAMQNFANLACQDMKNKALYSTRQLAKRQSTWQRQLSRLALPKNVRVASFESIQQLEQQLF